MESGWSLSGKTMVRFGEKTMIHDGLWMFMGIYNDIHG